MKTIKRTVLLTLIASASLLFSCGKDGDDGLPGPAGPAGNANVTSSTLTGNWIFQGNNEWDATLNVPSITSSVLNSGSISTYLSSDGGQTWLALPLFFSPVSMVVVYQLNTVEVAAIGGTSAPSATLFKVVIIPSSARIANPNVDYTNYEEVKTVFNLQE